MFIHDHVDDTSGKRCAHGAPVHIDLCDLHGGERFLGVGLRDLEFEFTNSMVFGEPKVVLIGLLLATIFRPSARQFRLILRTVEGNQEGSFLKPLSLLEGQPADPALDLAG